MGDHHGIYWTGPKWLLYVSLIFNAIVIFLAGFWFIIRFDIPFIHGGDKMIAIIVILTWWLLTSFLIFYWSIEE